MNTPAVVNFLTNAVRQYTHTNKKKLKELWVSAELLDHYIFEENIWCEANDKRMSHPTMCGGLPLVYKPDDAYFTLQYFEGVPVYLSRYIERCEGMEEK